ncbi:MAG: chorismate-binding protein, partial [Verrucomicrobia bacterium]|nr:chorismate-binding protein [Cytophagales bacterium]
MRKTKTFDFPEAKNTFIYRIFRWADRFNHVHFLQDNATKNYPFGGFVNIVAAAAKEEDIFIAEKGKTFESLQAFYDSKKDWVFGYLAYDLKNEIEDLTSKNSDALEFPEAYFYVPTYLFFIHENNFEIASKDREPDEIYGELLQMPTQEQEPNQTLFRKPLQNRTSKEKYLSSLEKLKNHILEGDIYEINYCMEFFSEDAHINPREVYFALNELSPMPFSAYLKIPPNKYAICASPERFLKKKGS